MSKNKGDEIEKNTAPEMSDPRGKEHLHKSATCQVVNPIFVCQSEQSGCECKFFSSLSSKKSTLSTLPSQLEHIESDKVADDFVRIFYPAFHFLQSHSSKAKLDEK